MLEDLLGQCFRDTEIWKVGKGKVTLLYQMFSNTQNTQRVCWGACHMVEGESQLFSELHLCPRAHKEHTPHTNTHKSHGWVDEWMDKQTE